MVKQKEVFLKSEGDDWFTRNHHVIQNREIDYSESIVSAIVECKSSGSQQNRLLEIGCGEGKRLGWISGKLQFDCYGIEPSRKAVTFAQGKGFQVIQGTADHLPFENNFFDFLVFGFCLYLCDREDLFRIAQEADRVLKADSWLVIQDFFSPTPHKNNYHHKEGLFSFKMDYRKLFDWHPNYVCLSHKVFRHGSKEFTDSPDDWVATSILRKSNS